MVERRKRGPAGKIIQKIGKCLEEMPEGTTFTAAGIAKKLGVKQPAVQQALEGRFCHRLNFSPSGRNRAYTLLPSDGPDPIGADQVPLKEGIPCNLPIGRLVINLSRGKPSLPQIEDDKGRWG